MPGQNILQILEKLFSPTVLKLTDESHKHVGHPETMKNREKLLDLLIVSKEFEGKSLMERHSALYAALKIGKNEEIHGITIRAHSPAEWEKTKKTKRPDKI